MVEYHDRFVSVLPVGQHASHDDCDWFIKLDQQLHVRVKLVEALRKEFGNINLAFTLGKTGVEIL